MRNYYIEQSSNRYTVNGIVEDWVKVPLQRSLLWSELLRRTPSVRRRGFSSKIRRMPGMQASSPAGKTRDPDQRLSGAIDVWDRYDYNGNGNFNEPDGYIDHFQAVHAG